MKQFCFLLFIAILGFYSCKKDSGSSPNPTTVDDQKLHSVQFNVNTFDVRYSDMSQEGTAGIQGAMDGSNNYINFINYIVYDSLGNFVKRIQQDSSMVNFGSINDSLKTGEYTIVVGAGNVYNKLWLSSDTATFSWIKFDRLTLRNVFKSDLYDDYAQGYDLFLYKSKIKVGNRDTVFNSITPSRIVGMLEIKLLETFPSNKRILYYVNNTPNPYSYLISNGAYTSFMAYSIPYDSQHKHILGSNNPLSITMMVQDNFYPYNTILSKTVSNVYIYPNKKTILTGKISDTQKTNINISVDTSYSGVVYQNF